ncbi:MAG: formate dehydrogenase [Comamonadaceae bacterium CG_4_9_14_3_um_filter_60_33]|nr:MAG: formate dehydrogenase [Comamonadaceae bacterium CG2_30_59_20]PIY29830.1 MAG: formate dehydrogenase [Comamonadaceae bacterium CG_4_10_14_3_um_filter_60_42]PJB42141.1 MAG: formate dehydrogenase [Comamonadaceae bacterium CG_4_9_14_3_um_filter_60_33]
MPSSPSTLSRRTLFAGAGTAGALAVAVSVLPSVKALPEAQTSQPRPKPENGGGYALTEHVKHYYQTARV